MTDTIQPGADKVTFDKTKPESYMTVTQEAHIGYKAKLWKIVKENGKGTNLLGVPPLCDQGGEERAKTDSQTDKEAVQPGQRGQLQRRKEWKKYPAVRRRYYRGQHK